MQSSSHALGGVGGRGRGCYLRVPAAQPAQRSRSGAHKIQPESVESEWQHRSKSVQDERKMAHSLSSTRCDEVHGCIATRGPAGVPRRSSLDLPFKWKKRDRDLLDGLKKFWFPW